MYYNLHAHTTKSSVGDSIIKIDEYIERAKEMKLDALAVTGHGSLSDAFEFYNKCKENDIKPIIGCELYETEDKNEKTKESGSFHLLVIAKDVDGFKNLLNIVSDASLNGFYKKPRTDVATLKKKGYGLIGTSACIGGRIAQEILKENMDHQNIINLVEDYKECFDEFFLEIQPGNFEEQILVNKEIIALAEITNTRLIIGNDVHYLRKDDWYYHDAHVKSNHGKSMDSPMVYPDKCYYMMNEDEIRERLSYIDSDVLDKAINNSREIVDMCNLELDDYNFMPSFDTGTKYDELQTLSKLCYEKLEQLKYSVDNPSNYVDRIERELDVIGKLGFAGYFLTIRDFIMFAKENDILIGPGRGSVGGSLIAYLIDIIDVDAIKHDLMFERFLSEHRKGDPDIDVDIMSSRRVEMFDYAIKKYGEERCAQVSTFSIRKTKAAIRDAAKICGIERELEDKAAKLVPQTYYDDTGDKLTDLDIDTSIAVVDELKELSQLYPKWFELARALADLPKATSIHAAGTIVSPVNLKDYIPLVRNKNNDMLATSLNLDDAEGVGFVKLDFLGLASLDVLYNTSKAVGRVFDYKNNKFDNDLTWDLIGSKNTTGLFQISSPLYKQRMGRLKPRSIEELANCIALIRGPCIASGADEHYMNILDGKEEVRKIHPVYDEATKHTNGILIYQENLMEIAINIGFDKEEAFNLMKAVAKKKMDKIEAFKEHFYQLGSIKNISEATLDEIFSIILEAGLYLFNKAHAVEYAYLCYATAYFKANYPLEYMSNAVTNSYMRKEKPENMVKECFRLGIRFLPLDVNKSSYEFTIEEGKLRIGFCAVKGFGVPAYEELNSKRPYSSPTDLVGRISKSFCGKARMIPAIFAGAFSFQEENRILVYNEYIEALEEEASHIIKLSGNDTFSTIDKYDVIEEKILSIAITASKLSMLKIVEFEDIKYKKTFSFEGVVDKVKKIKTKKGDEMAFCTLNTPCGEIDLTVFPDKFKLYKKDFKKNAVLRIEGRKEEDNKVILYRSY